MPTLNDYADQMIDQIADMEGKPAYRGGKELPYGIADFALLHDYFDANVGWSDEIDDLSMDDAIELQDIVHRRLGVRARTADVLASAVKHWIGIWVQDGEMPEDIADWQEIVRMGFGDAKFWFDDGRIQVLPDDETWTQVTALVDAHLIGLHEWRRADA